MKKELKDKEKKITRKEAIKKVGKYAAVTAAATFIIIKPQTITSRKYTCSGMGRSTQTKDRTGNRYQRREGITILKS